MRLGRFAYSTRFFLRCFPCSVFGCKKNVEQTFFRIQTRTNKRHMGQHLELMSVLKNVCEIFLKIHECNDLNTSTAMATHLEYAVHHFYM